MIEKLGYGSGDRLLIANADDFGITKATNQAIIDLFEQGAITSTSNIGVDLESSPAVRIWKERW
jgi:chitin disaccharide deacetylase